MDATINKSVLVAGETLTVTAETESGVTAAVFRYGSETRAMTLTDGVWSASVSTDLLRGVYSWDALATLSGGAKERAGSGRFRVNVMRSPHRDAIAALESASAAWTGERQSVSVGDMSVTYKSLSEIQSAISRLRAMADADERGTSLTLAAAPRYVGRCEL